jgi:hypothetical protein
MTDPKQRSEPHVPDLSWLSIAPYPVSTHLTPYPSLRNPYLIKPNIRLENHCSLHFLSASPNKKASSKDPSPMGGEPQFDRQSSFTQSLRSSFLCFSCCFKGSNGAEEAPAASLLRSSSVWIREKARGIPGMVTKFNRNRKASGDFRYDPISYALNFDGGEDYNADLAQEEMLRFKNLSSRLPASPSIRLGERPSSAFNLSKP